MNKLETLTAQADSKRLEYVVQEQLYINNYYYDHTVAMIAFEQMNNLKAELVAIRAEITGLYIAPKL
jgi:hypothetical protein|tara:strand:+ start:98 stop:298 length:201 start_codon:yes stop_codon:yes gene_type:complete